MGTTIKDYAIRFARLILGLSIGAFGVTFTVNANLGLSPWDVFAQGIAVKASVFFGAEIMMGTIIQIVGIFVLVAVIFLKETIGIGTIADIILFGQILNICMKSGIIPIPQTMPMRIVSLFVGFCIWSVGVYVYMSAGLGAGPRDSLMAALAKKNVPISLAKNGIEACVLLVGFLLGGQVGLGTLVAVFIMGYLIKFVFGVFKFDITTVENDSILDTIRNIKKTLEKSASV